MKNIILALLTASILAGCSEPTPEDITKQEDAKKERIAAIDAYNQNSINNPVFVGKTKNGDVITRAHIKYCTLCNSYESHYVYMLNSSTTDNYTEKNGKTTYRRVQANLNISEK